MSKICTSCGTTNADNVSNCSACGAMLDTNNQVYPANQGYNNNQPYAQPYAQSQPYQMPMSAPYVPPTSVGGWIGWLILCSFFPIIGQLIMLTSKDQSTKNYAKAQLILTLIAVVLVIFLVVLGALSLDDL